MSIETLSKLNVTTPNQGAKEAKQPPRPVGKEREQAPPENPLRFEQNAPRQLAGAITKTLESLGVSASGKSADKGEQAKVSEESSEAQKAEGRDVQQALQSFMHSLVQNLRSQNSTQGNEGEDEIQDTANHLPLEGSPRSSPDNLRGYSGDLGTQLQNLIQNISSQENGGTNKAASGLQSSFNNLVQTLQKTEQNQAPAQDKTPDLQAFLQKLNQTLQANGSTLSPLGGTVNTQV